MNIPIIANGGSLDIKNFADVQKFKEDCGAASVMVARAAQENVSVFRKEGVSWPKKIEIEIDELILGEIPMHDLIVEYLRLCVEFNHPWDNVKYSLRCMLRPVGKLRKCPYGKAFEAATSLEEIWFDVVPMHTVQYAS